MTPVRSGVRLISMIRKIFVVLTLSIWVAMSFIGDANAGGRKGLQPPPRLFEPTEEADLTGKSELLFRWGTEGDRSVIDEYQFKIYKGTQTVEAAQIRSEKVSARMDRLALPAELFENGQTYAWQLRGSGSGKTRPAYAIFKVKR